MTKMPMMLPKAELKTAAASLPPAAWVRITAEETGGGRQLRVTNLRCCWGEKGKIILHLIANIMQNTVYLCIHSLFPIRDIVIFCLGTVAYNPLVECPKNA